MEHQKNDDLNMLEAVVQNTEMGKNTLAQILPMASDRGFKDELIRQQLEGRIRPLRAMYRETRAVARHLQGYYLRAGRAPRRRQGNGRQNRR